MREKYLLILLQILLISCVFGKEKFTEERIKKIFEELEDSFYYPTSELKEKGYVYSVSNLFDENPNTCWATRVNGGVNEEILIFFGLPNIVFGEKWQKGISIINGFAKNRSLYEANNRAKEIKIKLYRIHYVATVEKYIMESIKLVEQTNIILQDDFGIEHKYYFLLILKTSKVIMLEGKEIWV